MPAGVDAVAAGGSDRARQPGAPRLGHRHLGQRLQPARPSALRRARQGAPLSPSLPLSGADCTFTLLL
jgi:hypothetical protein